MAVGCTPPGTEPAVTILPCWAAAAASAAGVEEEALEAGAVDVVEVEFFRRKNFLQHFDLFMSVIESFVRT